MKWRSLVFLSVVGCLWSAVGFATQAADYALAQKCYYQLKQSSETVPAKWQECLNQFEALTAANPKTDWAAKSRFSTGRLYQEKYNLSHDPQDIKKAIEVYNELIQESPDDRLADDSLYQVALIRAGIMQEKDRAVHALEALVEKYPNGDMVGNAKTKLEELKNGAPVAPVAPVVPAPEVKPVAPLAAPVAPVAPVAAVSSGPHQLLSVEPWTANDYAKVTLTFDKIPAYKNFILPPEAGDHKPARLVLDLEQTTPQTGLGSEKDVAATGLLKGVRMDQKENGLLRVVIDAASIDRQEILQVEQKLIVNVYRNVVPQKSPALPKKVQEQNLKEGAANTPPIRRIVIDPGHGGKDPGAIGPRGIKEKDVALQIAKKLALRLKKDLGLEVYLTRTKDVFLSLEERSAFAERKKADLFISIHANAADSKDLKGVETFYLNNASSRAAERLADRENKMSTKKMNDVQTILTTMLQNANTEESRDIAGHVQKNLMGSLQKHYSGVEDLSVHTALFYVLVGAKSPSILVETSFVTNPKEEMRLKDSQYQWSMALGITNGIRKYIEQQSKYASSL